MDIITNISTKKELGFFS